MKTLEEVGEAALRHRGLFGAEIRQRPPAESVALDGEERSDKLEVRRFEEVEESFGGFLGRGGEAKLKDEAAIVAVEGEYDAAFADGSFEDFFAGYAGFFGGYGGDVVARPAEAADARQWEVFVREEIHRCRFTFGVRSRAPRR